MAVTPVRGDANLGPLEALTRVASRWPRLEKTVAGALIAKSAWSTFETGRRKVQERRTFTVTVPGLDPLFDAVQDWLLDQMPDRERRALMAESADRHSSDLAVPDDGRPSTRTIRNVRFSFHGTKQQQVTVNGHRITVEIEVDDAVNSSRSDDWARYYKARQKIVFTAYGIDGRRAVETLLDGVHRKMNAADRQARYFLATRWGHWGHGRDLSSRDVDSVILRDDLADEMIADLAGFIADEHRYIELGLPWHRGYLLHGEPGTGKTSTARMLASRFGLDVYSVSLPDLNEDASLPELLGNIPPRAMLLIEDVDIAHAARDRDNQSGHGQSTAALLNALDGIATPHGLITVMTSNRRDVLDGALIRRGRVDREFEIGRMDQQQLRRLLAKFAGFDVPAGRLVDGVLPADAVEVIKSTFTLDRAETVAVLNSRFVAEFASVPDAAGRAMI